MPRQPFRSGRQSRTDRDRTSRQTRSSTAAQPLTVMTNSRANTPTTRQYMFIDQDANRNTSSEAIRVHVMRESHRARRQLRGLIQSQGTQGQMTILPNPAPSSAQPTSNRDLSDSSAEQSPRRDSESTIRTVRNTPPDLKSTVEQRLKDVLNTPVQIASASPGLSILKQLPNNVIDLCGDDSAALHALLALIASVQQSVSILQAAHYESAALEILQSRIADADKAEHVDETILTVLLLSRVERVKMNEETAGFHESALTRMIEARGGLEALQSSNDALVRLLKSQGLAGDS